MRPKGHAVLGGTFDHFHVGHAALLDTAFRVGRTVSVGVTTDRYLALHPKPEPETLQPYAARARAVRRYLAARHPADRFRTVPLDDRFGRSVGEGVDRLVVSAETVGGARAVNAERRRLGRRPLPVVVVPLVLADDLEPVSARRIRAGTIDRHGRRCSPIRVGVEVEDDRDRAAARLAVRRVFRSSRVDSRPAARPTGRRTAAARATRLARDGAIGRDLGVGVARDPRGGWAVAESSRSVALAPRRVLSGGPDRLERALEELMRPPVGRLWDKLA